MIMCHNFADLILRKNKGQKHSKHSVLFLHTVSFLSIDIIQILITIFNLATDMKNYLTFQRFDITC